jgi:hypothetical protein
VLEAGRGGPDARPTPPTLRPQSLDEVQAQLDGLAAAVSSMGASVAAAKASCGPLLAESDKLAREVATVETKTGLVAQFLDQYQLTPEEVWGGSWGEKSGRVAAGSGHGAGRDGTA